MTQVKGWTTRFIIDLGVGASIIANASPDEKDLCLSSAGNIISVFHRYTLGLLNVSSLLVPLLYLDLPCD